MSSASNSNRAGAARCCSAFCEYFKPPKANSPTATDNTASRRQLYIKKRLEEAKFAGVSVSELPLSESESPSYSGEKRPPSVKKSTHVVIDQPWDFGPYPPLPEATQLLANELPCEVDANGLAPAVTLHIDSGAPRESATALSGDTATPHS